MTEEAIRVIGNCFTDSIMQADGRDVMEGLHRVHVQDSSVNHAA